MYKALNQQTGQEIIILSQEWRGKIPELRTLDHQNSLVCQGCMQPVRVRAPRRRRTHFAHKHLKGCSYGSESPAVLEARAIIYEWLITKFPGQVTIEEKAEVPHLPRAIDCWVKTPTGAFACWVIDATIKYTARQAIFHGFDQLGVPVIWILLTKMLHPDDHRPAHLHLSPTERDYLRTSPFDEVPRILADTNSPPGQSLHYLDPITSTLTTYRDLYLVHPPQLFRGRKIQNPLAEVLIAPENGEIAHPGEIERKERYVQEERQKKDAAQARKDWLNAWSPNKTSFDKEASTLTSPQHAPLSYTTIPEEAACVHCGQKTREWWAIWGEAGARQCKCRECLAIGLS